jgi:hypothetical protein
VSLLGANYGATLAENDPHACLDIGPTTDQTVAGRPTTDNKLQFEDLILLAVNYEQVAKTVTAAATVSLDEVLLYVPETPATDGTLRVQLGLRGTGRVQGMSVRIAWDPRVVEPVGLEPGAWLLGLGGVALTPEPGVVDLALLGRRAPALAGEGLLATLRLRVVGTGAPGVEVRSVDARDVANRHVETIVRIGVASASEAPRVTQLFANVPNPFNPSTRIPFALAVEGRVELAVFGVDGRKIRTLVAGARQPGKYEEIWDGSDDHGQRVSSGTYYVRLVTPDGTHARPIVLVK